MSHQKPPRNGSKGRKTVYQVEGSLCSPSTLTSFIFVRSQQQNRNPFREPPIFLIDYLSFSLVFMVLNKLSFPFFKTISIFIFQKLVERKRLFQNGFRFLFSCSNCSFCFFIFSFSTVSLVFLSLSNDV
jgi:hypothetical protein